MSKLNGDGKKIVDLLCQKIDDSQKQTSKRIDDIIASNNAVNDRQQELLHSHCSRIRKMESENVEMRPVKKFYCRLRDFALGLIVFLGGTVIAVAAYLKAHISS